MLVSMAIQETVAIIICLLIVMNSIIGLCGGARCGAWAGSNAMVTLTIMPCLSWSSFVGMRMVAGDDDDDDDDGECMGGADRWGLCCGCCAGAKGPLCLRCAIFKRFNILRNW